MVAGGRARVSFAERIRGGQRRKRRTLVDVLVRGRTDRLTEKEQTMTEYLLAVHGNPSDPLTSEAEIQQAYAAVDAFNQRLEANGAAVFIGGLHPVEGAKVVDAGQGAAADATVTDGPFSEVKEVLGGCWVVLADSLDAALALAKEGSQACGQPVEVREFAGD